MTIIKHLFEEPQYLPLVAKWIYDEFWTDKPGYSSQVFEDKLTEATQKNKIPLSFIAFVDGAPAGTVNLIENDDEKRTHLAPWLAALVVQPEFRSKGVGSMLVKELNKCASGLGFKKLYLGTDNPGFYERLGAKKHEHVKENFYIMRFDL